MIFNVFFAAIAVLITTVFGILPDLPPMPVGITNVLDVVPEMIHFASRFFSFFIGGTFLLILIPILVIFANFNWIYHLVLWIIKKLPIGVK